MNDKFFLIKSWMRKLSVFLFSAFFYFAFKTNFKASFCNGLQFKLCFSGHSLCSPNKAVQYQISTKHHLQVNRLISETTNVKLEYEQHQ